MIGYDTSAGRKIAGDAGMGGRQIVAAQLKLACDELDRMRERDAKLKAELGEIRVDRDALEIYAGTLTRGASRFVVMMSENPGAVVTAALKEVRESDCGDTPEDIALSVSRSLSGMLSAFAETAARMSTRIAPSIDIRQRIVSIGSTRSSADLGCDCAKCSYERAKADLHREGSA